jgi:hypothetical protein
LEADGGERDDAVFGGDAALDGVGDGSELFAGRDLLECFGAGRGGLGGRRFFLLHAREVLDGVLAFEGHALEVEIRDLHDPASRHLAPDVGGRLGEVVHL